MLTNWLEKAERECIPKKKSRQSGKHNPLLMNAEYLKLGRNGGLAKKYTRTEYWRDSLEYTTTRNQARRATRQAVWSLEQCAANEIKINTKHFWKYAQCKGKARPKVADHKKEENSGLTTTHTEKAEVLNKLYSVVLRG